jgi:hypothetical protein
MNQQEREMIEGLFQRLQQAEAQAGPRDDAAEALIRERMAAHPGAAYLLAQVVLVQEQGMRNLQTRVEELEREGVGAYGIKAALNHKTTGDVTGLHDTQVTVEDLRPIMQTVEDAILRRAEQRADNVVTLRPEVAA